MSLSKEIHRIQIYDYLDLIEKRPDLFGDSRIVRDFETLYSYAVDNSADIGLVYASAEHYLLVDLVSDGDGEPPRIQERFVEA